MEKWISNKIADWCIKKNNVTEIQEMAIRYGIELYFDSLIKILVLILIGAICGRFIETVVVISCFCLLRGEAGGIHMQTSIGCFLSMCSMTIVSVVGAEIIPELSVYTVIFVFLLSLILIYCYAPYATSNNPISDETIRAHKKIKAIIITMVYMIIALLVQENRLRALILIPVIIEIITILPFWKRKEESEHADKELAE